MSTKSSMHVALCALIASASICSGCASSQRDFIERNLLAAGTLKTVLDNAFADTKNPEIAFDKPEFTFLNKVNSLVLFHEQEPNLIIKYLPPESRRATRLYTRRNIDRITVAQHMRELIEKHCLEHIVVPHKWLYHIPGTKDDLCDTNYLVIAQWLELLDPEQSRPLWLCLSTDAEDEMRFIIKETGFDDVRLANLFFTPEGKIAFIDTEPGWAPLLGSTLLKPLHKKICGTIGLHRLDKLKAQWEREVHEYYQAQVLNLQEKP